MPDKRSILAARTLGASKAVLAAEFPFYDGVFKPAGLAPYVLVTEPFRIGPATPLKNAGGAELDRVPTNERIAVRYWTEHPPEPSSMGTPALGCIAPAARIEVRDQHGNPPVYVNPEGVRDNVLAEMDVNRLGVGPNETVADLRNRNTSTAFFVRLLVSCGSQMFQTKP